MSIIDSRKLYNNEMKAYKGADELQAIHETKKKLDEYYSGHVASSELFKKHKNLVFIETQQYSTAFTYIGGLISGVIASVFTTFYALPPQLTICEKIITILVDFSFQLLLIVAGFILTIAAARKIFADIFALYIVPYEKLLIEKKMFTDYGIDLSNGKRVKVIPEKIF